MKHVTPPKPNPVEELTSEISSLQTKLSWLQESVRLAKAQDGVEDLQTTVSGMAQRIANLRQRGYVFEKELETQASDFARQWATLYPSLQQQINVQSTSLQSSMRPIEAQMAQLSAVSRNPMAARPLLNSLKSAVAGLEDKVAASESTISGMYDQFSQLEYPVTRHLDDIEWMLQQLAEASFQLLPTEAGIRAVKAVWCKTGDEQKGDPEGVLFLTDGRLIFEQKEKVATKKVLFITTEKQKVQSLQWDIPVAMVDNVGTSKHGVLKNEDHIEVRFVSGASREMVHLHIWQSSDEWQGLINRAKAKDFDKGRAVAVDQAAADKVKAAPSQCPSCGGNLGQVILRGQETIKCEYCGYVIRL